MPPSMSVRFQDLADPSLRRNLEQMIRARVPSSEVDDLVQATLTDALASASIPSEAEEVRRWVFGIARHKIVDFYRRSRREQPGVLPEIPVAGGADGAKDMIQWAEKELSANSQGGETLDWMLREGDGEKLENIAEEDRVPAPRVRQRVSRWRKHLRERWAAELAAVAALAVVIGALYWAWRYRQDHALVVAPDNSSVRPVDSALLRAADVRSRALKDCDRQQWQACVAGLDEAARLDPAGDTSDQVVRARKAAAEAQQLLENQAPTPAPTSSQPIDLKKPAPVQTDTPAPKKFSQEKDTKKMAPPVTKEAPKTKSDLNYNVTPYDNATPPSTPTAAPQTPGPQQTTPQPQQQLNPMENNNDSKDIPMQQKAPKKTKGGKPTSSSKESSSYDWGSTK